MARLTALTACRTESRDQGTVRGLSDCALEGMTEQLTKLGVLFATGPAVAPRPNPAGTAHQPWVYPPWDMLPRGPRIFRAGLCLSKFARKRMAAGLVTAESETPKAAYAPGNLAAYLAGHAAIPGMGVS